MIAGLLIGCEQEPPQPFDTSSCGQDEAAQIVCIQGAFDTRDCPEFKVRGSMFRRNEREGTFDHRTEYLTTAICLRHLREKARERGFIEEQSSKLVLDQKTGYREQLILGEPDGLELGTFVWERIQQ